MGWPSEQDAMNNAIQPSLEFSNSIRAMNLSLNAHRGFLFLVPAYMGVGREVLAWTPDFRASWRKGNIFIKPNLSSLTRAKHNQSTDSWLGEGFWSYSVWCCVSRIGSSCSKDLNSQKAFGEEVLKAKWGGGLQGAWSAYGHFSDWLAVMQQGGIIFQESMSSTFCFKLVWGFPRSSVSKESASNAGDLGSIPISGRSLGEGNGNSLQYSCLENPMDRGAWQAAVHGVTRVEHDKPPPVWVLPVGGQHVVAFFPLLGVLASLKWVKNMGQYIIYSPWGGTEGPWLCFMAQLSLFCLFVFVFLCSCILSLLWLNLLFWSKLFPTRKLEGV